MMMPIEDAGKVSDYWVAIIRDAPDAELMLSCRHIIDGFDVTWTRAEAGGRLLTFSSCTADRRSWMKTHRLQT